MNTISQIEKYKGGEKFNGSQPRLRSKRILRSLLRGFWTQPDMQAVDELSKLSFVVTPCKMQFPWGDISFTPDLAQIINWRSTLGPKVTRSAKMA